jgi:hypothetical protein
MSNITRIPVVKRRATTVSGVIRQTMNLLKQEGRWIQRKWFSESTVDPQQPLCHQGWGACSDGMLQAVIFGVPVKTDYGVCQTVDYSGFDGTTEQESLYFQAFKALSEGAPDNNLIGLNDTADTRDEVVEHFRKAYRHAQYVERKARAEAAV